MKKLILFILLALAAFVSNAQVGPYGEFYYLRFYPGGYQTSADGTIRFNFNTHKFEFREGQVWKNLGDGGTGTGVTDGDKGDISVSGSGESWFIDNAAVTLAKMQTIGTSTILGRSTAGTGLVEQLTPTQVNTMLPLFNSTTKGLVPLSGGGTTNFLRADGTWADPAAGGGGGTTETASNLLTKVGSDIRLGGTSNQNTQLSLVGGNNFKITEGSYAFGLGTEDFFWGGFNMGWGDQLNRTAQYSNIRVAPEGAYINAKGATGASVELSIRNDNVLFTDNRTPKKGIQYGASGYETTPTSLTTVQWVEQQIAAAASNTIPDGDKGDVSVSNSGSTWNVDNDAITYAKMQNVTGLRFLGRSLSTTGDAQELTGTTATSMLNIFTTSLQGMVPASGGGTTNFLRADGTWSAPPSGGGSYGVFTSTVNGLVPASGGGTTKYLRSDATWATFPTIPTLSIAAGQVAYASSTSALKGESVLTYNETTDELSARRVKTLSGPTYSAFAETGVTADPSSLTDGDRWYRTDTDKYRGRANGTSVSFITDQEVSSGTYTPTASTLSGQVTNVTFNQCMYTKVGSIVDINGSFNITYSTSPSESSFRMNLPIASNIASQFDISGISYIPLGGFVGGENQAGISGVAVTDNAQFYFPDNGTTSVTKTYYFQCKYIIK